MDPGPAKVLARRAEHVSHLARKVLASLVLAGGRADVALLAEALGVTESQVLGGARELERRSLVRPLSGEIGGQGRRASNTGPQAKAQAMPRAFGRVRARSRGRSGV